MKKARLSVEEKDGMFDFATVQFNKNEDPVKKYLGFRKAEEKSPMFNRVMPKTVTLQEIL